jgi:hypothetical protein
VSADSLPNLVGTWRLVSYEARTSAGETRYPLGRHVVGQLFYDVRGNMSGHVMRIDRPTFASNDSGSGTDAEVRAAFEGHTSYFGTYTIDPSARTVTHHVRGASYPNWMGHDQIRYYRSDGSDLVLSSPPILSRHESLEYILTGNGYKWRGSPRAVTCWRDRGNPGQPTVSEQPTMPARGNRQDTCVTSPVLPFGANP